MSSNRGRQKSIEKKKKRRVEVRSAAARVRSSSSPSALIELAASFVDLDPVRVELGLPRASAAKTPERRP